jgi:hypothetical protein
MHKKFFGVIVGVLLGLAALASPAQAHQQTWLEEGYACWGAIYTDCGTFGVSSTHLTAIVCDRNSDGVGAWAEWIRYNGARGFAKDPDGNGGSCGTSSSSASQVKQIRYCGHDDGLLRCGSWRYVS